METAFLETAFCGDSLFWSLHLNGAWVKRIEFLFMYIRCSCFYDEVNLKGQTIDDCIQSAAESCVHIVVLDDQTPLAKWVIREVEQSIEAGNPIVCVYRADKYKWEEVGEPFWTETAQNSLVYLHDKPEVLKNTFARGAIRVSMHIDEKNVLIEKMVEKLDEILLAAKQDQQIVSVYM